MEKKSENEKFRFIFLAKVQENLSTIKSSEITSKIETYKIPKTGFQKQERLFLKLLPLIKEILFRLITRYFIL